MKSIPFRHLGPILLPSRISRDIFKLHLFIFNTGSKYYVLEKGNIYNKSNVLVRINSKCVFADIFGSARCDCREQLHQAMRLITKNKEGLLIYAYDQDGRGISLEDHIKVYELQDKGFDTVEANIKLGLRADQRNYDEAIEILRYFKIKTIKLLTNNPDRIKQLENNLIKTKRLPLEAAKLDSFNVAQLAVKKMKLNHIFSFDIDKYWMKEALDFAKHGLTTVKGRPLVGCIIVKNHGIKVGEGYCVKKEDPPAEVIALRQAGKKALNATMYVTLEPGERYGIAPAYMKTIIESGIKRIFISMLNPFPIIRRNGVKELKDAGIEVNIGLLQNEAKKLNKKWLKAAKKNV